MANDFRADSHLSDADLAERILGREVDDFHLSNCPNCRTRRGELARLLDPSLVDREIDSVDEFFFRRQAARVRARIDEAEAGRPFWLSFFSLRGTRFGFAGAATLAILVAVFSVRSPLVKPDVAISGSTAAVSVPVTSSGSDFLVAADAADDRFLLEVDELLDEDPWGQDALDA